MSACPTETTIPGFLKRIVDPHATDSSVCCSDTHCTKTFADGDVYARELAIYQKNLPYVPRLLSHDRRTRTIVTERVGTPLGTVWNSGVPFIGPLFRSASQWKQNRSIRRLHKKFRRDTGLYHNDILYKNVLRDGRRLYLVDFERCGAAPTDGDTDGILSHQRTYMIWKVVISIVIVVAMTKMTYSALQRRP